MTDRVRRPRRTLLAVPLALLAALLLSGQVSAIIYMHQTGMVGPWSFAESVEAPGVTCNYGPTSDGNAYFMTNIKVQPPTVYAADRNSGKVDTRKVSWQFQIQRKHYPDGAWAVVASSAIQKATAKENVAAPFTTLKIKHPGNSMDGGWLVRIQVLIKWYKPTGGVEGTILFRPSYYALHSPDFLATSGQPYCQEIQTNG